MRKWVWVNIPGKFTCSIDIDGDRIVKTAPILKRFRGQNVQNLRSWLDYKFKPYNWKEYNE